MLEVVQQRALQQVGDEERQMQRLCAVAVDTQLQRLEAKLQTVPPPSLPPLTPYHPPTPTITTTTHLLTLTLARTLGQVEELGGILQREREQIERAQAQARPFIPPSTHPLSTAATSTTTRPLAPPAPLTPPPTHGLQVFSERLQFERRRLAPPGAPVPTHGVVAASAVPQAQPRTG